MEKLSSMKPVPGAEKVGDRCCRGYLFWSGVFDVRYSYPANLVILLEETLGTQKVA